ncbi:hypothetical protein Q7P37_006174 [Cladosporium fusiforme]
MCTTMLDDVEKSSTGTTLVGEEDSTARAAGETEIHDGDGPKSTRLQLWIESLRSIRSSEQGEVAKLRVRTLDEFRWGYPRLAIFQSSDEVFGLYRRFGYLQSRLLLEKQDALRVLEDRLNEFDLKDKAKSNTRKSNVQPSLREELLKEIEQAFNSYATLLSSSQRLTASNRPTSAEYRSVQEFLEYNKPVVPRELDYIRYKDDLITLRPGRDHAWLDRKIEHVLRKLPHFLSQLFCSKETRLKCCKPDEGKVKGRVVYFSRERIDLCASALITAMIIALLIVPIYLLYRIFKDKHGSLDAHSTGVCIGVLLVSTLLFSAILSLFTRAKRHELLGAAAAYCAVLVVFLGNVPN